MSAGFIYVLSNPSMPGLVKIGKSSNIARDRARALRTTGVPTPFNVEFEASCRNADEVERRAHRYAQSARVDDAREFFALALSEAVHHVLDAVTFEWNQFDGPSPSYAAAQDALSDLRSVRPATPGHGRAHLDQMKSLLGGAE